MIPEKKIALLACCFLCITFFCHIPAGAQLLKKQKPNIIYIYADDLGMVSWDVMDNKRSKHLILTG